MTEAIIGLLGVIVGGFINVGVSFVQEKRERRQGARVAARLVLAELERNGVVLHVAGQDKTWRTLQRLDDTEWANHREQLAGALPSPDWEALYRAYYWIGRLIEGSSDRAAKNELIKTESETPFRAAGLYSQQARPVMARLAGVVSKPIPSHNPEGD